MARVPEIQLADALLAIEPAKVAGGSKSRRDWLGIVLDVQAYLLEGEWAADKFIDRLLGEKKIERTVIGG